MVIKTKRVEWIDVMKGILILFVILSHTYPAVIYRLFFTPFFLTMFFWASGYTFSLKSDFKTFLCGKGRRLIIPFFVLGSIRVLITCVLSGQAIGESFGQFSLQINCKGDEMWFVSCLFVSSILFYGIIKMTSGRYEKLQQKSQVVQMIMILAISGILMIVGFFDMKAVGIKFAWELELACVMVFYMALGFCYKKEEIRLSRLIRNEKFVAVTSILYLIIACGIQKKSDIHAEQIPSPFLFVLTSLLAIAPLIWISETIAQKRIKKYFIFLGQNTIFYYAFAGIVRIVLYGVLNKVGVTPDPYIVPMICTGLAAVLLVVPAKLTRNYIPWAIGG